MRQVPQVIVCMVHGAAAGIGFSFALSSDVRIIAMDARFSAAYINIGFGGADMACSYFLPRMIGAGRAYEFMLTGNFMSAKEAMDLGFASRMVERDDLMNAALELARTMNGKNPAGLHLTKEAININMDIGGLEQALGVENRNQALIYSELLRKPTERRQDRYAEHIPRHREGAIRHRNHTEDGQPPRSHCRGNGNGQDRNAEDPGRAVQFHRRAGLHVGREGRPLGAAFPGRRKPQGQ